MSGQLFVPDAGGDPVPGQPASRPLAARMRPDRLDGVVGQHAAIAPGSPLQVAIESGRPFSMLLHGPPGTGKTTLARIAARSSGAAFEELSAVAAGKAEVTAVLARARARLASAVPQPTVLFLDEIHRFNKAQQDALLPAVEDGTITLIGATTESPAYTVVSALLSRLRQVALEPLESADLVLLLRRAAESGECGPVAVDEQALELLASRAGGDARAALGALELAATTVIAGGGDQLTRDFVAELMRRGAIAYDRDGDQHYDTISAWIKATRASDPDASLYYLAVMLEGGEDARFIARRMVILASEDIGNAAPQALGVATAAAQAVELVGLPEAAHALAQCAVYLALAPKSNAAYAALGRARAHVREHGVKPPPPYLRSGSRGAGGYDYPHDHASGLSTQRVLPEDLGDLRFYLPGPAEQRFAERADQLHRARNGEPPA